MFTMSKHTVLAIESGSILSVASFYLRMLHYVCDGGVDICIIYPCVAFYRASLVVGRWNDLDTINDFFDQALLAFKRNTSHFLPTMLQIRNHNHPQYLYHTYHKD